VPLTGPVPLQPSVIPNEFSLRADATELP